MALAVADPQRHVITYDPNVLPHRDRYLSLVDPRTRGRIQLVKEKAQTGPAPGTVIDMIFIDGDHSRKATAAAFRVWERVLVPGGVAAFHDYGPVYPIVAGAVEDLGLEGVVWGNLFLWYKEPTCSG
jgi:predicted O-methyltransferase YrrM